MTGFTIRRSVAEDALAINQIANWYIENTAVNFDSDPWPIEKRIDWFESFNLTGEPWHLLVAEDGGEITGFACNTRFRPKAAYDSTTETSVYIANDFQSRGHGGKLYSTLLNHVAEENFHRALGVITLPNPASIALHERLGFCRVGLFDEVGMKFGEYHTVAMYQKDL
jgi:phosphinothricin acetyltransferase